MLFQRDVTYGRKVSGVAAQCPHCGYPLSPPTHVAQVSSADTLLATSRPLFQRSLRQESTKAIGRAQAL